ncbi:MAG: beta-ketoacyl-ACP synthase, partial [Pseudomonadota bacterium]
MLFRLMDIRVITYESTSAAGINVSELRRAIDTRQSGLRRNDLPGSSIDTWIGKVPGLEEIELGHWQSRNNALADLAYRQGELEATVEALKTQVGSHRVGVVMGSSTSSIDRTEQAYTELDDGSLAEKYRQAQVHNPDGPALFVAERAGITGPAVTINTACSSSAKAFATAARWLTTGIVDVVLAGGVDTLCLSVLHGFHSLQLVSSNPCKPLDRNRDGINLGEAAGYALLIDADSNPELADQFRNVSSGASVSLRGYGESSDAHHMSHPHPEGAGARSAMLGALATAKLDPGEIGYVNLHGTSSRANDLIEGKQVADLFPSARASSTKAWMGHTLGAAGITEAIICIDALHRDLAPGTLNLDALDDGLELNTSPENTEIPLKYALTNSFGFGGNNCSLLFEK